MLYKGRYLDPILLWSQWIQFPHGFRDDGSEFSPLLMCPNPDHDARKPHFQLNQRRPLCHCFSNCGISGTYERAIALIEGCTEKEARKIILKYCQISGASSATDRAGRGGYKRGVKAGRPERKASTVSLDFSTYVPGFGTEYLAGRGIDGGSIAKWGIGWDQDERRIVIPADDERGIRRFLIKRAIRDRDWPKYLYWPEKEECGWGKQDILFGACHLDPELVRSEGLVLVEGSLDTIVLHQNEVRNASGILGSSVSERQARIISKLNPSRVVMLFDKDVSGFHAMQSAVRELCKYPLFVALYPKGKNDPAEMTRKEVEKSISSPLSLVAFNNRLPRNLKLERKVSYAAKAKATSRS